MANNKKRYLTFEIYPDNPEQMNAFEWLRKSDTCSGMYIKHEGEDGGKDHYHVMVYEDNGINCKKSGDMLLAESYAKRFGTFECCITDEKTLYKCKGDELPECKAWETKLTIPIVQGVSDPSSLAHYFLHERYVDIREGKKLYTYDKLQFWGEKSHFTKLYNTNDNNTLDIRGKVISLAAECISCKQLIQKAVSIGEWEVVEYCEKNPYFVKTFLLSGKE